MRILLLSLGILFASELEVQGDLKVSGSIDAQNNPVKNVGVPHSLTDAINGNVLQDALREDGVYEFKFIPVLFSYALEGSSHWGSNGDLYTIYYKEEGDYYFDSNDFSAYANLLSQDGWILYHRTHVGSTTMSNGSSTYGGGPVFIYEFKRIIEE